MVLITVKSWDVPVNIISSILLKLPLLLISCSIFIVESIVIGNLYVEVLIYVIVLSEVSIVNVPSSLWEILLISAKLFMPLKASLSRVDLLNLTVLFKVISLGFETVNVVVNSYPERVSVEATTADAIWLLLSE